MSCCPAAPKIVVTPDSPPLSGPEQVLRPGETLECFSQRAGNSTGKLDDTTSAAPNSIITGSIAFKSDASIDLTFKASAPVSAWAISGDALPTGVTFDAGRLHGTATAGLNQKYTVTVTATFADGTDSKTYSFSPSVGTSGNSIQLLLPIAGGTVRSPFGPRLHPIQKIQKLHTGIDIVHSVKGVNHPILCAADGIVLKAKNTDPNGYGNAIHVKHFNGNGEHLCTTTYNHLFQMFVSEGQKVMAGQKIALEGGAAGVPGSGGSTGLHLHFECKLPNGSFTDPVPFIRGDVPVNNGDQSSETATDTSSQNAVLTKPDVDAKQGCPAESSYPADPAAPEPAAEAAPSSAPASDPFEAAWYFTMKYEVGPNWPVQPGTTPTDSEIAQGLCDTPAQCKKVGYVNWATETGGETKFGIAKSGNPKTDIKGGTYSQLKDLGYSNYWKRGKVTPSSLAPYIAVFMFDTNYNHGSGNGKTIYVDSGCSTTITAAASKADQLVEVQKLYQRRLQFAQSLKTESIRKGVSNRVTALWQYVQGLNL